MICKIKNIVILILLFVVNLAAQSFPAYTEREFLLYDSDTTKTSNKPSELEIGAVTEGIIDPAEYHVGPGDILQISIIGIEESSLVFPINQEGYIFLPDVGIIDLRNLSLSQAKEKIEKSIRDNFRDVTINISLMGFRKIRVRLTGEVVKPLSQIVPSNTRLFDFMMNSNVLLKTSDIRNINIIHNDGEREVFDLLDVIRLGGKENNPYLLEGDIISISKADRFVYVFGHVLSPGTYEYVEEESPQHLIDICGGYDHKARTDSIEIISYASDHKTLSSKFYSKTELKNDEIILRPFDKIIIRGIPEIFVDRLVTVEGFVKYPGVYRIQKDSTDLFDLMVNEVGGFLENASLRNAYVNRVVGIKEIDPEYERLKTIPRADMTDDEYDYFKSKSREKKGRMVVDFEKLFTDNDSTENIILKRGDVIVVPELKNYITLVGQVVNPGNVTYDGKLSVDDYISLAGGYSWRAIKNDVRVIKSKSGEWVDADDVSNLEPGDIIWVPEEPPPPKFWDVTKDILSGLAQFAAVVTAVVALIIATKQK
ncbi:MAG: hypothetical protein GXO87_13710 [Chlorobi bacterium]|nr:hypothetical protein [Chlorobiota bacterium]